MAEAMMEDEVTKVPEGLPSLTVGSHPRGSGEACVMELVSVLAGEEWTDFPVCVNKRLAYAAQHVNDNTDDEGRRQLLELAPLFIHTRGTNPLSEDMLEAELHSMWKLFRNSILDKCTTVDQYYVTRIDSDLYVELMRTRGIPMLRAMIEACDSRNGYDRSAQEAQPVVETLREIVDAH